MTNNLKTYILTGGKSSRFGEDKLNFLFNGKPILQYVIDSVSPFSEEIVLVGNSEEFTAFNSRIISDSPIFSGPISGIHSIFTDNQYSDKLIIAGDMPFLENNELKFYLETAAHISKILIPKTEEDFGHNLHVLIKKEWTADLLEILSQNPEMRSVHRLWEKFGMEFFKVSEDRKNHYWNVNERKDLMTTDD